jgi:hypothetical protein
MTNMTKMTWVGLNELMMEAGEQECLELLRAEKKGPARTQFLLRIHSRLNRLRAERERVELREFARSSRHKS